MTPRFVRRTLIAAALFILLVSARGRGVRTISPAPPASPTFNKEIVRIFQQHCQTCHHPGDIAPFSLTTYADAKPHALEIKLMTKARQMPPWKPSGGCGEFDGERLLPQSDIDLIAKWVDAGAPEGNPADLPAPIDFSSGWTLGEPDLVFSNPEPFTPEAHHDVYRCFTLPTNLTSNTYVSSIDVHPGDRKSVHHVIAFIDQTGVSQQLDEAEPGPGYTCFGGPGFGTTGTLGGWAPGARPIMLPPDVAYELPANSRVVLQVHYHVHGGEPQPDRTELGIYLAKQKPAKLFRILPIVNTSFTIPPGEANYKVDASFPFPTPFATHVYAIAPHMHLLGKKMKVEATLPNGTKQCLIDIQEWDFNWQGLYRFKDALPFPAGTRFSLTSYYDNSANNPKNPNHPPKAVSWGEATTDEMCIAFLGFTIDAENIAAGKRMKWPEE